MMRILHVVSVMDVGGMESYIMNMYRRIDRTKIQFDFLVHHRRRGAFEDEIEALGGRVFHTAVMDDLNLVKYRYALRRLFSEHREYRIVHGHLGSTAFWYLGEAKRQGVGWRILHGHCPNHVRSPKGYAKHLLFQFAPAHANVRLACSTEAGRYLFKNALFEVIPNGIEVGRFVYSAEDRRSVRERLKIENRFVVGHVGRFHREKNHAYILEVFGALKAKAPEAVLMLLGEGKLMESARERARALGVDDSVLFLGLQKDCAPYYQAMDAFILPSLYEGLPLTGLEAQCAGLPCLFSDTVSPEARIGFAARFLPIGAGDVARWVEALLKIRDEKPDRMRLAPEMENYDAALGTRRMVERYAALWEREA